MPIPTTGAGTTGTSGLADLFMDSRTQTDTDAAAFITAASITDPTQVQAVYTLVGGLKALGLWAKMTAVYPFIGGSAASHAVNAKSPGTFNITWNGGVTHNSNGITGNGSTGYGDTGINSATSLSATSFHFSAYQRISSNFTIIGNSDAGSNSNEFVARTNGVARAQMASNISMLFTSTLNPPTGFFTVSRTSSNTTSFSRNGIRVGAVSSVASVSQPSSNVPILAYNSNGVMASFSTSNLSFVSIGSGLTDSEAVSFSALVQYVQTLLGRAV